MSESRIPQVPELEGPDTLDGIPASLTTGRFVVVLSGAAEAEGALVKAAGMSVLAHSREFAGDAVDLSQLAAADAVVFDTLQVAVVSADPDQVVALRAAGAETGIVSIFPELIHHALPGPEYVQGYRDGVTDFAGRLQGDVGGGERAGATTAFQDTDEATWGLQATRTVDSPLTGRGVKVAVLDTGFDVNHPDFADRSVTTESFVQGETVQDGHGHGTHCIGTSCGPRHPQSGPGYGVAYEAEIFAGKVLGDQGSGSDQGIIAGIDWAVSNGCQVISMSLGADVRTVHTPYTVIGRRALTAGSLIIAAAGNNARRSAGNYGFVGVPANSPTIMAVGALDQRLSMADFSARSSAVRGGQVDIAGPGYQVYSSWPMPTRYRSISGTSMATPHIAGLAALWAQATGASGLELWAVLAQEAQRLDLPSVDVGGGIGLAPPRD